MSNQISPDGQFMWNGSAWVPNAAPQMLVPPPPPTYVPPPPPAMPAAAPGYLPPGYGLTATSGYVQSLAPTSFSAGGDDLASSFPQGIDFGDPEISGNVSLSNGDYVVRIDDIEHGASKAVPPNPKATFTATVTHGESSGRKQMWSYPLSKSNLFRLGKALVVLNMGVQPNGQKWSNDTATLCAQMLQYLRGKQVMIRVSDQIDRITKLPSEQGYKNTTILGYPDSPPAGLVPPAQSAPAPIPSAAPAPPPPSAMPQVTYPAAPPPPAAPNGVTAFHTV